MGHAGAQMGQEKGATGHSGALNGGLGGGCKGHTGA